MCSTKSKPRNQSTSLGGKKLRGDKVDIIITILWHVSVTIRAMFHSSFRDPQDRLRPAEVGRDRGADRLSRLATGQITPVNIGALRNGKRTKKAKTCEALLLRWSFSAMGPDLRWTRPHSLGRAREQGSDDPPGKVLLSGSLVSQKHWTS